MTWHNRRPAIAGICIAVITSLFLAGIDEANGSLQLPRKEQSYRTAFSAYDVRNERAIEFSNWVCEATDDSESPNQEACEATGGHLRLEVTFTQHDGHTEAAGSISDISSDQDKDNAIVLKYTLPILAPGAQYSFELNPVDEDILELQTATPIAVATGYDMPAVFPNITSPERPEHEGIALAIPPDAPVQFAMRGSDDGLGVNFYLGLVKPTHSSAPFKFIIYPVDPEWGFRSALEKYYNIYDSYYDSRLPIQKLENENEYKKKKKKKKKKKNEGGLWLWFPDYTNLLQLSDTDPAESERLYPLYRFHEASYNLWYQELDGCANKTNDIERNRSYGILTFPYFNIGARGFGDDRIGSWCSYDDYQDSEVEHWQCIETNYDLGNFSEWDRQWWIDVARFSGIKTSREGKLAETLDLIHEDSLLKCATNPDPDLFLDSPDKPTMAKWAKREMEERLFNDCRPWPEGIYIDSLSKWSNKLNYNKEHFEDVGDYPLTFDPDGEVVLHSRISHYKFLSWLRSQSQYRSSRGGPYLFGNGIGREGRPNYWDDYNTGHWTHYYDEQVKANFFLASLLDVGGTEVSRIHRWAYLRDYFRVSVGRKPFTNLVISKTVWDGDPCAVRKNFNAALPYAIFVTNASQGVSDDLNYYLSAAYERDRELTEQFVRYARWLQSAGWQPVTKARILSENTDAVRLERYGPTLASGGDVYFALVNDHAVGLDCECSDTCDTERCVVDEAACVGDLNITLEIEARKLGAVPGTVVRIEKYGLNDDPAGEMSVNTVGAEGNITYGLTLKSFKAVVLRLRVVEN